MTTRYQWNDDDRKNDYISYYDNKEEEYVPVYKILKEMYDEDKAKLYNYKLDEEYQYKYGQDYFNKYCDYYNEYYSQINDSYTPSSVDSETDVCYDVVNEDLQNDDSVGEKLNETEKEHFDNAAVVEEQEEQCVDEIKSKFIYT